MLSIQKQLINYNFSKRNGGIKYIVVHDVGAISTAQNNRDYFAGGNRNASADFFVDSNNIIQIIDYHNNYSWAVGDGRGRNGITNGNSVSIEICLENNMQPSEKTIQNTLDLVKYLMNELNLPIDRVVRHYDASFKNCPQSFSANNWAKWHEFKARLAGIGYSQPQSQSSTRTYLQKGDRSGEVKQIQTMLIKLGYNCGGYGADGAYGQGCVDSVKSFQSKYGLSADGLCGVATKTKIKEEYNKLINKSNQNASQNTNKKEEEYDMENIVVYGNEVDQRIAETLADFLQCPTIDGKRPFNYSKIKNVICVGGKPLMTNGKIGWTGYMTKELSGGNRYETIKLVLDFIEKYNK